MPRQLPSDCLNEIFEYLKDETDLRSCLLVNRQWCEVTVRILWRNIQNYNILISCLPEESKENLCKNGIIITSKPPLFNYITFIKSLSIGKILNFLKDQQPNDNKNFVVTREIFKMFMGQITLKKLELYSSLIIPNIPIITYPGAIDCLRNLSEFGCSSNIDSEIFYQMSQICHNLESLNLTFEKVISNGLTDLISVQKNLTYLYVLFEDYDSWRVPPPLKSLNDTLIKLRMDGSIYIPLIGYITLPNLKSLKFGYEVLPNEPLFKFMENCGKNLWELDLNNTNDNSLNLAIAKFCPNMKSLRTLIKDDEAETLRLILDSCEQLESIYLWCGGEYLNAGKLLEMIVDHSPKNFHELKMESMGLDFFRITLKTVFRRWANRTSQYPLSLIIIGIADIQRTNRRVIKKFRKLGIIKFEIIEWYL
ncbi:9294_t:CDS:2 [Funneliformis caledonium]|uniref:9294_t:CDS:1 n=1 Tax=Funneliformis caledonium TaxID=1117310 RepID=A0A9N8WD54_9GLOM|nr:9294_t:CDS:2 [Funneliformis caledonium]